jgi:hypothetical protein
MVRTASGKGDREREAIEEVVDIILGEISL